MTINRYQAIALYGSAPKLATALGYNSRHAVYNWPAKGSIPREPYMRLRYELKPEAFDADGKLLPAYDAEVKAARDRSRHMNRVSRNTRRAVL